MRAPRAVVLTYLRLAAGFIFATAVFALCHPYLGITGDASLYLGQALADLDPTGVGRDIVFAYDGQSRFSIFSRLVDPLVAAFGVSTASIMIALAASACVLASLWILARALTSDRRIILAILIAAAVLPAAYGDDAFRFAEASAIPRPFAEAMVLVAIAALLVGRWLVAALLLFLALLIHPIMAMAGIGTMLVFLAWRSRLRDSAALMLAAAVAAAIALTLGALGVPLFDRLVVRVDPEWLTMLRERNPYLFPSLWHGSAFVAPIVQATTIALAAQRGNVMRRRVLLAVIISAVLQLVAAVLLADALHVLLAVQVQSWRACWLLAAVGGCCLPLVAVELWRRSTQARVVLALLSVAWFCPLGLPSTIVVCIAIAGLSQKPLSIALREKHATWALIIAATLAVTSLVASAIAFATFVDAAPRPAAIGLLAALRSDLLVVPTCLALGLCLLAPPWLRHSILSTAFFSLLACATVVIAATNWDQRAAADTLFGRQDDFPPASVIGDRSSEVLVVGGLADAWIKLGRPQYFSHEQGVSIVFSRPLAMEWRRRATLLRELDLVPPHVLHPRDALTADDRVAVTPAKLATLCKREDAPSVVVVPDRDDSPAPRIPGAVVWKAVPPRTIIENEAPLQRHLIRGWVVEPCAAKRLGSTLAKTSGQ